MDYFKNKIQEGFLSFSAKISLCEKRRAVLLTIKRADKAGFCFGVNRAIDMTVKAASLGNTASLGPLIHNQQVVDYLASKGIGQVNSIEELRKGQQLVIRSHGVPPEVYTEAENKDIKIIDATCPYVQKAQRLAKKSSQESFVIVVGDKTHPEVIGILGWAGENAQAIESLEEAKALPYYPSIAVLAQTTQRKSNFNLIVDELRKHTDNLIVHNTICSATEERQVSAGKLAESVGLMIVVGGKSSSNTRKLKAICSEKTTTYLIETADELQNDWFKNVKSAGLTAGASTPDWIIEEVYRKMSEIMEKTNAVLTGEDSNQTQDSNPVEGSTQAQDSNPVEEGSVEVENSAEVEDSAEIEDSVQIDNSVTHNSEDGTMDNFATELPTIYGGAIVKGTVVKITDEEVFVDIGWKSEGIIPIDELASTRVLDINDIVKVGDQLKAMVIKTENKEGHTVLSRKRVVEFEARERLAELAETKEEVQAKVTEIVKGGVIVDLGMRGFVPASQLELSYVEDLNVYLGKTLRLRVIEYDQSKKKLILSQKDILLEEQKAKKEKLLQELNEGDVVKGIVRRLTNFGAFVDLGGIDGLLHVSDMAFSRIKHPSEIVQIDDEVEVQILAVDRERERVSLGLKQLKEDPWSKVAEKYPVGDVIKGEVVRIAPFGAFVNLEDGVDALVHISQLDLKRVAKVEDVVQVGQIITAKVIESKPEDKRISLSMKELLLDSERANAKNALDNQPEIPEVVIGDAIGDVLQNNEE